MSSSLSLSPGTFKPQRHDHSFLPSVSSAVGLWTVEWLSVVYRREPKEFSGDWERLGEHRKKTKVHWGVSVNGIHGMRVRRASVGRDQESTKIPQKKNPVTSDVHTRTLILPNYLNSECSQWPNNILP